MNIFLKIILCLILNISILFSLEYKGKTYALDFDSRWGFEEATAFILVISESNKVIILPNSIILNSQHTNNIDIQNSLNIKTISI